MDSHTLRIKNPDLTAWAKFTDENTKSVPKSNGVYIFRLSNDLNFGRLCGTSDLLYIGRAAQHNGLFRRIRDRLNPKKSLTSKRINELSQKYTIEFAYIIEARARIHALGAPVIFGAVSYIYFKKLNYTSPTQTAIIFLSVVISLDFFVVALLIERSFEMFYSLIGTWIPFALIFSSTYLVGRYVNSKSRARG